jgi:hypothetical protein
MKHWIIIGILLALSAAAQSRAAVVYTDNFSAGLKPQFWSVEKTAPSYVVDATQGDVRMSIAAGGGYAYRAARVYFTPQVVGNFDMSIHFRQAQLTRIDSLGAAANQIALHAEFGGQHFNVTRDIATVEGNNFHVYLNPPGQTYGVTPTTVVEGDFRIVRTGNTYAGYFDSTKVFEQTFTNTAPQKLWFSLENNQTNDAISVIYDDFSINAENIIGIPEPTTFSSIVVAAVVGLARRRHRRAQLA